MDIRGGKRQRTGNSLNEMHKLPVKHRTPRPSRPNLGRDESPHTAPLRATVSKVEGLTGVAEGLETSPSTPYVAETLIEAFQQGSAITSDMRQTHLYWLLQVVVN